MLNFTSDPNELVPLLSNDINFSPFNVDSKTEYLLHQTKFNYHLKISKQIFDLLGLVDGKKNLNQISSIYNSLHDDNISVNFLQTLFYDKLVKYGVFIIENYEVIYRQKANYLKLSFTIIKKEFISPLTQRLSFLFRPHIFLRLFVLLTLFLLLITILNFKNITEFLKHISAFNVYLYLFLNITSALIHELGHASALRSYNLSHGDIGFGFYLLMPVLYSDVTNAWKLNNKDRLKIDIGGIYFELVFSSFLIIIYLFTNFYDLVIVVYIIMIKTLYNLNPLIRSDGYWLLSDAINVPNLRNNSFSLLKSWIRSFPSKNRNLYSHKEYFFLLYATVSFLFTFILLFCIIVYDYRSVIYFPVDIYNYIKMIALHSSKIKFEELVKFVIPALFYYLTIKLGISFGLKLFKRTFPGRIRNSGLV